MRFLCNKFEVFFLLKHNYNLHYATPSEQIPTLCSTWRHIQYLSYTYFIICSQMFALLHLLCPSVKVSSPLSYQTLHYYSLILNPDEYPRLVPFVFLGSAREPHRKNGDRSAPWAPQGSLQAVSQSNPSSAAQGRIRGNRFPPGLISRKLGLENSFEITQPRQMLQAART